MCPKYYLYQKFIYELFLKCSLYFNKKVLVQIIALPFFLMAFYCDFFFSDLGSGLGISGKNCLELILQICIYPK